MTLQNLTGGVSRTANACVERRMKKFGIDKVLELMESVHHSPVRSWKQCVGSRA